MTVRGLVKIAANPCRVGDRDASRRKRVGELGESWLQAVETDAEIGDMTLGLRCCTEFNMAKARFPLGVCTGMTVHMASPRRINVCGHNN